MSQSPDNQLSPNAKAFLEFLKIVLWTAPMVPATYLGKQIWKHPYWALTLAAPIAVTVSVIALMLPGIRNGDWGKTMLTAWHNEEVAMCSKNNRPFASVPGEPAWDQGTGSGPRRLQLPQSMTGFVFFTTDDLCHVCGANNQPPCSTSVNNGCAPGLSFSANDDLCHTN